MLGLFKKKSKVELYAPVSGNSIALENVPDKVFADKLMGEGIAFELESNKVCSPCNGKVMMLANTLHAVGIQADNGAEILIHIGLDTVNLNGEGFQALVQQGDKVKQGTPLIEIDLSFMRDKNIVLTTPMVITNSNDHHMVIEEPKSHVIMGEDKVITFE